MVEILVTMLVLAIGLLGVASLQFVGSFTNAEALSRTQAEMVTQQAAERLRIAAVMDAVSNGMIVNDQYFANSNYNFGSLSCASADKFSCFCESRPSAVPNCEGGACTQAEMAVFDAWTLSCAAIQSNPQTTISLNCNDNDTADALACSPGSFIQIQLRWPIRTQKQTEVQSDTRCLQDKGQAYSCVTKVVVL